MEANTVLFSNQAASAPASAPQLVDRVNNALAELQSSDVWARGVGRHVLLGVEGKQPSARLTALGGHSYGLSVQSGDRGKQWQLLLVDDLAAIVEHALVACTVDRT
jgi:hypothetical protein